MRTLKFSEADRNLRAVIDQVIEDAEAVIISDGNGPDVVLMSLADYTGWMETVHLLSSPTNSAHLAKSIAQARAGDLLEPSLIEEDDSEGN